MKNFTHCKQRKALELHYKLCFTHFALFPTSASLSHLLTDSIIILMYLQNTIRVVSKYLFHVENVTNVRLIVVVNKADVWTT